VSNPEPTKVIEEDDPANEPTVNISIAEAQKRAQAAADTLAQRDAAAKQQAEADRQAAQDAAQRKAEEARIREQERAARAKALGTVEVSDDDVTVPVPERHTNDKFLGSAGLALIRLVLAAILGVRGVQVLWNIGATTDWLTTHSIPNATPIAWSLGALLLIITVLLVVGFGVRLAGLLTAAVAILMLVFIQWGYANPFVAGQAGFTGDWDVVVAGVGLALFCLGSGGWAIDAAMRFNRAKRKQYQ